MSDTIQPAPPLPVGAIGPFIGPAQSRTNFWSALEPTFWLAALVTCTSRSKDAMTGKTRKDRGKAGGNAGGQVAGGRGAVQQACACCRVGWSPCILACSISICAAPLHSWLPACTPAHSLRCCLPTCAPIPSHHAFCKSTHPIRSQQCCDHSGDEGGCSCSRLCDGKSCDTVCLVLHAVGWHLMAKLLTQVWLLLSRV